MVWKLGFMTLRTGAKAGKGELFVCPAFVSPGLRDLMFWIGHRFFYLLLTLAPACRQGF